MESKEIDIKGAVDDIYAEIFAPILVGFVAWVIKTALDKGITRLYFLARDGYLMHKIATTICKEYAIQMDCKYLYCSRTSFRIPSYHLFPQNAYEQIFGWGYEISAKILLNRLDFSEDVRRLIYDEIGFDADNEEKTMDKINAADFVNKIKKVKWVWAEINKISNEQYHNTFEFFKQNQMLDGVQFAVVDSGWTGSMQKTLKLLLGSKNINIDFCGFYFGMFYKPNDMPADSYNTYYFSKEKNFFNKVFFNNNVFETLCVAPHPMTMGYDENGSPILKEETANSIDHIESTVDMVTKEICSKNNFEHLLSKSYKDGLRRKIRRFMVSPTKLETEAMKSFSFSDDVVEGYKSSIVSDVTGEQIKQYNIFHRIMCKIKRTAPIKGRELFWQYGSIVNSDIKHKGFYKFNFLVWSLLKYLIAE